MHRHGFIASKQSVHSRRERSKEDPVGERATGLVQKLKRDPADGGIDSFASAVIRANSLRQSDGPRGIADETVEPGGS